MMGMRNWSRLGQRIPTALAVGRRAALSVRNGGQSQQQRCCFSTVSAPEGATQRSLLQEVPLSRLAHQSHCQLLITDATDATIRVIPTLQPTDFSLRVFGAETGQSGPIFAIQEELDDHEAAVRVLRVSKTAEAAPKHLDVELRLPHLVDLDISSVRGRVELEDKLEGNVRVALADGDIHLHKIRGEQINLKTNRGRIHVASLIEGDKIKLAAAAIDIKRLMSSSTEIKLAKGQDDSALGAVYSQLCLVNSLSSGALRVGNIHGFLRVVGEDMSAVRVDSVNGSVNIEDLGPRCNVDAHFDAWTPDASSKIFVGGDVAVTLDPTAAMAVELHGSRIDTKGCAFGEHELDQLDEDYAVFSGDVVATASSAGSSASGKINSASAKEAALRTSFFAADTSETPRNHGDEDDDDDDDDADADDGDEELASPRQQRPRLVVHASSGSVKLEQLDWMAKLKRKHLSL